ncbi:hypothetical protein KZX46_10580 [Polymorphobacter sp. PAMC 29334]|uniref:hypothetical protein n=1 Tax=Polymorphobacter sp. PAMC 29334 TaxID=2862331 RepID=UPI001C742A6E|nr:hypothetical protein [Polymorphobacter sp. PAMC 29334]QYE36327.1 hypothetical protein KZX46_10580 [Polymorphobacter sp. PAMC 29334]
MQHVAGRDSAAVAITSLRPALRSTANLLPITFVIAYPWLLRAFHAAISDDRRLLSVLFLALVFAVPAVCGLFAWRLAQLRDPTVRDIQFRRLNYLGVTAPTMFVFLGVLQSLVGSPLPDVLTWTVGWTILSLWAAKSSSLRLHDRATPAVGSWRVAHGIIAAVVLAYVLFHIGNHLFGLVGPNAHHDIMEAGRYVYRARLIEPVLVGLFVAQVVIGLRLAWRWTAVKGDFHRVFQVASGLYLSVFILGHMNSVFIYARTVKRIPTGWDFATGAPGGLLHDAWNIRLLPHYALGVFFVLAHLASGLRIVLLAHGVHRSAVDALWSVGVIASVVVSAAIIAGMCGVRI